MSMVDIDMFINACLDRVEKLRAERRRRITAAQEHVARWYGP